MKLRSSPPSLRCLALAALLAAAAGGALAGPPSEDVKKADEAASAGDVFGAMKILRPAAEKNDALAQARLADLLHAAEFDAEALDLYRKSAAQGEPAGEFGLAVMYIKGAGVKRDPAQAVEWLRKAEKKDYALALDKLADAYRRGELGLPKDPVQAAALEARRQQVLQAQTAGRK